MDCPSVGAVCFLVTEGVLLFSCRSKAAVSALDHLLKPTQYKTLGALKQEENLGTAW
jgi:hypothetical protein